MTSLLLAAALLAEVPAGGPLDGSLLQDIREARQDVRALKDSIAAGREEARLWRDRTERLFDGKFLDRIGTLVWLTFWVLIVAGVCFGLRQAALVLESFGKALTAWKQPKEKT